MFRFKPKNRRFRFFKRVQLEDPHLTNDRSITWKGYIPQYRSSIWKRSHVLPFAILDSVHQGNSWQKNENTIFTAKNTAKSKRAVRQEHQTLVYIVHMGNGLCTGRKCSYKSHRTQDIKHFLISSKTNPYSRATTPPPPLRRRTSKGTPTYFAPV